MQRKMNKKGFTIVELVIVIAVIAILAAVLIPTFVSLTRKANIANDTAVAKNLNTAAISSQADTFDEAIEAAKDAGYLIANLNAKADECYFVWEDDSNQFLLYDLKENKVVYSNTEDYGEIDESWCFVISDPTVADAVKAALPSVTVKQAVANVTDLKAWIAKGGTQTIYCDESLVIDEESAIVIPNGVTVTLSLGGSMVSGVNNETLSYNNVPFIVDGGVATFNGGVLNTYGVFLDGDGNPVETAISVNNSGTLNIVDTEFNAVDDQQIIVDVSGGSSALLDGITVTGNSNNTIGVFDGSNVTVEGCEISATRLCFFISGGSERTSTSIVSINGGTYNATGVRQSDGCGATIGLIYNAELTIEDGAFESSTGDIFRFYGSGTQKVTLKGGTFNGVAFTELTDELIKGMISDIPTTTYTITKDTATGYWIITTN